MTPSFPPEYARAFNVVTRRGHDGSSPDVWVEVVAEMNPDTLRELVRRCANGEENNWDREFLHIVRSHLTTLDTAWWV